ncbi:MAG: ABC transporter permease [Anaerolineaceae bacterium]
MRFIDLISVIIDNLGRRKGRVVLTAIGVVIGTAAVVTLVSLGAGLQQNATNSLWGISDLSSIQVYPGYPEMKGNGPMQITEEDIKKLTPDAIAAFESIPDVERVIVFTMFQGGSEIKYDKLATWGNMNSVNVADLKDMGLEASQGVTTLEKNQMIVGSWIARNFYNPQQRPDDPPLEPPELFGETLKVTLQKWSDDGTMTQRSFNMEIVGVLKETKGESDSMIYVPESMMRQWNDWAAGRKIDRNKQGYDRVVVRAVSPENTVEISEQINDMGYQAYTPQSTVEGINSFFTIMQVVFGAIGAIALLVAAIGIANTMTMSILERTREIGIMKAIGATNNNVLSIFLGEAAGIGFLGGIGGAGLGWLICALINVYSSSYLSSQSGGMMGTGTTIATAMPFWLPIFSVGFATVVGLLSGLYPALNAATMIPVNALKYE